jgi:hypothetical protein
MSAHSLSIPLPTYPCLLQLLRCCRVQYGGAYESAKFMHNTADAITMILFSMIAMLVRELCV